jgi:hypothetical protein
VIRYGNSYQPIAPRTAGAWPPGATWGGRNRSAKGGEPDSISLSSWADLAEELLVADRFAEAIRQLRKTLDLERVLCACTPCAGLGAPANQE